MGEAKTPVTGANEGLSFGPQFLEEETVNDKQVDFGKYNYYVDVHGLSERDEVYQTLSQTLSGEAPIRIRALNRIRTAYYERTIPTFIVKQAIQDAAGKKVERDPDLNQRFRFVVDFFFGEHDRTPAAQTGNLEFPLGDWVQQARCLGVDHESQELFFTDRGESTKPPKEVCLECPAVDACLEFALKNSLEEGIWGGTSGAQRRQIKQKMDAGLSGAPLDEYIVAVRTRGITAANRELKKVA